MVSVFMEEKKVSKIQSNVLEAKEAGLESLEVLITFGSDKERDSFQNDNFELRTNMRFLPVSMGVLKLSALEALDADKTIRHVEANVRFKTQSKDTSGAQ